LTPKYVSVIPDKQNGLSIENYFDKPL